MPTPRILSGIKPTGKPHIGNYFGMMRPAIEWQDKGEAFYFIADYHALTTVFDPAKLREYVRGVALDFLACGLDPAKAVLFRQSDVPEHTELAWLLSCQTPMPMLENCHAYKDHLAKGKDAVARALRLSGADGGGHPHLRREHRAGGPRPEAARGSDARSREQDERALRQGLRRAGGEHPAQRGRRFRGSTGKR